MAQAQMTKLTKEEAQKYEDMMRRESVAKTYIEYTFVRDGKGSRQRFGYGSNFPIEASYEWEYKMLIDETVSHLSKSMTTFSTLKY